MDNLEYKVISATTPVFSSTARMQAILAEEAEAGWRLLEKSDNHKVRLVRDISARANDAHCRIDPYRSEVGISKTVFMVITAVGTLVMIYLIIQLAAMTVA